MVDGVRVLLYKEAGFFVAQCLEYDIGAQGSTIAEVKERFSAVFEATLQESKRISGKAFGNIGKAPKFFEGVWDNLQNQN